MVELHLETVLGRAVVTLSAQGHLEIRTEDTFMKKFLESAVPNWYGLRGHLLGNAPSEYDLVHVADARTWEGTTGIHGMVVVDRPTGKPPGPPPDGAND